MNAVRPHPSNPEACNDPAFFLSLSENESYMFDQLWKETICFFPEVPYWSIVREEKAKAFAKRVYALTIRSQKKS